MKALTGFLSLTVLCVCMYFGYVFGVELMESATYKEGAISNEPIIYRRK